MDLAPGFHMINCGTLVLEDRLSPLMDDSVHVSFERVLSLSRTQGIDRLDDKCRSEDIVGEVLEVDFSYLCELDSDTRSAILSGVNACVRTQQLPRDFVLLEEV